MHSPFTDKFLAFSEQPQRKRSEELRYPNVLAQILPTAFLLSVHVVTQVIAMQTTWTKMCQSSRPTATSPLQGHTHHNKFGQTNFKSKVHETTNPHACIKFHLHPSQRLDAQIAIQMPITSMRGQVLRNLRRSRRSRRSRIKPAVLKLQNKN
jgi:hypothetical protein